MVKLELGLNLKNKLQKCLNEADFNDIEFKQKLEDLIESDENYIEFDDLKKLKTLFNNEKNNQIYLHELITGSKLYLPKYEAPPRVIILENEL